MRIIIFGGSFDPIHKGHIKLAKKAISYIKANKLFFVPVYKTPTDKHIKATYKDRVQMIKEVIKNQNKMCLSMIEKNIDGVSYTYKTIEYFKNKYPNAKLFLLVGKDQYDNLPSWKKWTTFKKDVTIIAASRDGEIFVRSKDDIVINNFDVSCSSSSLILNPRKAYLYQQTINYINRNGLYWYERLLDNHLTPYRIGHSKMVAELALKFAKGNGYKHPMKAWVAGIYHDIAKEMSEIDSVEYINKYLKDIKKYPSWKVLHAYIGADILKNKYLFNDNELLDAIYNHTIVQRETILNKIIYCADKLVPRNDDSDEDKLMIKKLIGLCTRNINKGYIELTNFINKKYQ